MSLSGPAVPLATEPKTRRFEAPWAAATRSISVLCARRPAKVGTVACVGASRMSLTAQS